MTPSVDRLRAVTHQTALEPAAKKRKLSVSENVGHNDGLDSSFNKNTVAPKVGLHQLEGEQDISQSGIPPHPLRVKPLGNQYGLGTRNIKSHCGYLAALPDELLLQLLEFLAAPELVRLGSSCKALYAFCRSDDLWKSLFLESPPPDFQWLGTWRNTYLSLSDSASTAISCTHLFSDALFRPFQCANIDLTPFTVDIPPRNRISRLADLSVDDFSNDWASIPFILTSPVKSWPIFASWDISTLLTDYHKTPFRAEAVDWPLSTYVSYMRNNNDESPLYLFDRSFVSKMNLTVGSNTSSSNDSASYTPPTCFGDDLFATALGDKRPDSRWLIIGPERSGSTFHKDPNGTSAWNAVLRGSKYWIMFPSSPTLPLPPGVFTSADQSEVTSPLSIAEWLLTFHAEARATPGCKEGICYAGEVLHVPSGWFHLVVNLEEAVAVTQNFVPKAHLVEVLAFLRDKKDQVSGFGEDVEDPYEAFVNGLRGEVPGLLEEAMSELERRDRGKKSAWEEVVGRNSDDRGAGEGFSFGFGFGKDEELSDDDGYTHGEDEAGDVSTN